MSQQQQDEAYDLVNRIGPLLSGRDPAVQGAVLADLVARWLAGRAGHDTTIREQTLERWLRMVRDLVPMVIADHEPPPPGPAH
jgi:hypothetical protein